MKTFVTGGTGFVGAYVVRRLLQSGHEPHCLVRAASNRAGLEGLDVTLVTGDVTDRASVLEGMDGCDCVVHLANIYSWWEPDKGVYRRVNVEGTRNVMECALETHVWKVVHTSTAYVYGTPAVLPFTEETPVGQVRPSRYTRTKHAGDLLAWQLYEDRGLPLVIIYPGIVMGPGDPRLTGRYIRRFVTGQIPRLSFLDAVHTYVHVADVAEATVRALEKEGNFGQKYLVGKHQLSIRELNELISEISGAAPPPTARGAVMVLTAALATWLADLRKIPPRIPPIDYVREIRAGCRFDGSKAEAELGLTYTPVHETLREAIESLG